MIYIDGDTFYCMRCKALWLAEKMTYHGRHGLLCPECVHKLEE